MPEYQLRLFYLYKDTVKKSPNTYIVALKTESCFWATASLHRQLINGKILKV